MSAPSSDPSPSDPLSVAPTDSEPATPGLVRAIGPVQLVCYGVGSMLGAGIYALIGTAAGELGNAVWLAFAVSMVAALLTVMSYACIGSRYPRAGGAAYVTHRAYGRPLLTYAVGLAVACSGLASMATGARAIGNEIGKMGLLPDTGGVPYAWAPMAVGVVYLTLLAGIVFRGIKESMVLNVICTAVEAAGLLLVIAVGARFWGSVDYLQGPPTEAGGIAAITTSAVLAGAVLTFFSFIGFEDILNVSEEVKDPRRNVPIGLIGAMGIATLVYVGVAITAVSVGLPHGELVKGGLRAVLGRAAPWFPGNLFSVITIFAVANTALLNYVMSSRLVYGMSRQGLLPAVLGKVHPTRHTPHVAIVLLLGLIILLMASGALDQLAAATVLLLLTVFALVNAALVVLKLRPGEERGGFEPPVVVPVLGSIVCATLAGKRVYADVNDGSYVPVGVVAVVVAVSVVLYLTLKPRTPIAEAVEA